MKRIRTYGGTFINREVLYTTESHLNQRQIQEIRHTARKLNMSYTSSLS